MTLGLEFFNLTSGSGTPDVFISKLDSAGNFLWAKRIGANSSDRGYSIVTDQNGNVVIAGFFTGIVDFDPGPGIFDLISAGVNLADIFVMKLNSAGDFMWAKKMGGTSDDQAFSVSLDISGNVYTAGWFMSTADFDPGSAVFNLTSTGGYDAFVSKLDNSGNFIWAKTMGGSGTDRVISIAIDTAGIGDIYFTGNFQNMVDFDPGAGVFNITADDGNEIFISKLSNSGNFLWAKNITAIGAQTGCLQHYGYSIALDPSGSGEVYTTGKFCGFSTGTDFDPGPGTFILYGGGNEVFVLKLNSFGNFVWAKATSGSIAVNSHHMYAHSIALNNSGIVYITGNFLCSTLGWVNFGSDTIYCAPQSGTYDFFIAKLDTITIITGNNEIKNSTEEIILFPNPTTSELVVSSSEFGEIETIEIYSSVGEKVFEKRPTSNVQHLTISVADFLPGIYFITVTDQAGNKVTKKVVKM